jgi:DNA-binding CsgD family transcriptional regulator
VTAAKKEDWNITPVVDAIGAATFAEVLLTAFNELFEVNHLVILRIDQNLIPQMVAAESFGVDPVAQQAGERYKKLRLYHGDPNLETILKQPDTLESPMVARLLTEDISNPDYRREVFEKSDIVERVSIINQRSGRWFMANIYRDKSVGVFKQAELNIVTQYANLLSAIVAKHISMLVSEEWSTATRPPLSTLETTVRTIGATLSKREVEVCARALSGLKSEGIGLDLNIKPTTVTTLRQRANAKLNISTTNELFALCLGHAIKR